MTDKTKEPIDKGMIRVFVYGTLKRGHANHPLLDTADAIFIGFDSITGPYQMYDLGGFPAVIDSANTGNRVIRGELWAITPDALAGVDLMEGHPTFYRRRKLVTNIHERRAWMYFLTQPDIISNTLEESKGGVWHAGSDECKFWLKDIKKAVA